MHTGTVKWFNSTKGYGFVEPDDKSRDVFIHIGPVLRTRVFGTSVLKFVNMK